MPKVYDLVVATGSYKDSSGNTKKRFKNVGVVNDGDNGMYVLLDRSFNPAGVPNPENKDMVIISMFDPKEKEPVKDIRDDLDDEIPF